MPDLTQDIGLHVVAEGGIQRLAENVALVNLDPPDRLMAPLFRQTFTLINEERSATKDLRLSFQSSPALRVFCARQDDPTPPQLLASEAALPPLQPGQRLTLWIEYDLMQPPAGTLDLHFNVMRAVNPLPVVRLEVKTELRPLVTFSPASLDFGPVPAGQTKACQLNLVIDRRMAPLGAVPRLFCTNSSILIQPIPLDPSLLPKTPLLTPDQKRAGRYSYLLTLSSDASIGQVSGNLIVAGINPPPPGLEPAPTSPMLDPSLVLEALHTASVTVTGRVEGDLTAAPTEVAFGGVMQGKEAVQSVWLTPKSAKALEGVQFNCPVDWLSARLIAPLGAEGSQGGGLPRKGAKDAKKGKTSKYGKTSKSKKNTGHASLPHSSPTNQQAIGRSAPTGKAASFVTFAPFRGQLLDRRWVLDVILSPKAPVGRLQTQMILTLANGQRLVLPIVAVVMPRNARATRQP